MASVLAPPQSHLNAAAIPSPNKTLHLTFALVSSRRAGLEACIQSLHDPASPQYHHWLTPDEVGGRFGADAADVQAVRDYAAAQGFKLTHTWPNRLFISADATVAQAERAFGVKLQGYDRPAALREGDAPATFFAPDHAPQLPAAIAQRISGVFGLSNFMHTHSHVLHSDIPHSIQPLPLLRQARRPILLPLVGQASLPADPRLVEQASMPVQEQAQTPVLLSGAGMQPQFTQPLSPSDISTVYNIDPLHTQGLQGQNIVIGVFSPTLVDPSDIDNFALFYGISGYGLYEESVDGGATDYNGIVEADLDAEMIIGQANAINVLFYECPNDGNMDVWNQIATDNVSVVSNSWSLDEGYVDANYVSSWDTILAIMDAQGQAHYNASGDNGAFDRTSGVLSVGLPGSDPHVTCVGGTSLPNDNNGAWESETGWSGSGGGLSNFFALPSWQTGPGVANSYSDGARQMPDVAAIADPNTPGVWVFTEGQWAVLGGTSAATPLWATVNKLINQAANTRTGSLNSTLYAIGTNLNAVPNLFVFHDITTGNDGYYSCTPGWDYVTGWGSANFYKLYADLELLPNLRPINPGSSGPGGAWTSPIMIHKDPNSVTEPSSFNNLDTYYFAISINDDGPADAIANVQSIQIDGVDHTFVVGPFPAGYYLYNLQAYSTKLAPGKHTIKLMVDANNAVKESNENDNVYTRIITVQSIKPHASSLTLVPNPVQGGNPVAATVALSSPAPAAGAVVTLTSSQPSLAVVPINVTVPAGATSAVFTILTGVVTAQTGVQIAASYGGASAKATLKVLPPFTLKVNPASGCGGDNFVGTVTLTTPAGVNGAELTLASGSGLAAVPGAITIGTGAIAGKFIIKTQPVTVTTNATITATYNGLTQAATITLMPPTLSTLTLTPNILQGGQTTSLTVTLSCPAPLGGATVTLSSDTSALVSVPNSITVPAGSSSISLSLNTSLVNSTTTVNITGAYGGATRVGALTLTP